MQGDLFPPVSMACLECDAEGFYDDTDAAASGGWTEVLADDADNPAEWYTHTGVCPDCAEELSKLEVGNA
jgi:hypothetical protein